MTPFNESRLLDQVSYGSEFGHRFSTRIVQLKSGHERRNAEWELPRARFSILYGNLLEADHELVIATHRACHGALVAFRFKDWTDYRAEDEPLGTATEAEQTVQLTKRYSFGTFDADRKIAKPVFGTVTVYADGQVVPGATVDYETGEVELTATAGAALTWSGEFDVPVRFEDDEIAFAANKRSTHGLILTGDVMLIEVRL